MKFLLAFLFVCCFAFAVARPTARSAGSVECTICEFAASYVEGFIAANATEQEMISAIETVCDAAPAPLSTLCDNFVQNYLPKVIAALVSSEPPATVCTQLGLCAPSSKMEARVRLMA
ncbi:proactivator polypeptide, putative [Acanthamoeba castellanii str. Neff]|uniref:Proactivator polypeptide, putative n=1 Tax=Acanthamoeba castellanii (strain ATCC 30010 / Neff) TaxID=1257118 RepID=L8HFY9_ACACF|nr:proactivator polypeptide, putative [Acanthamoeba castellanii str. Neff]ELR24454.1 proactivator polypeptide, putative [Acanthamoeba castellanii str. Neff]